MAALIGAGALALSLAFPGDVVRDRLVAEVKARTGRDLTINGPVSFSAVPNAHVSLHDVTLSAPEGMDGPPLAAMQALDVRVSLWPLLWREVIVESVHLQDPVINLAVDAGGRTNWDMSRRTSQNGTPVRLAQAAPQSDTESGIETATDAESQPSFGALARKNIANISLNDLRIDNGTIRFSDARSGKTHEATSVTAQVAVKSLTTPATANGSFLYRGEQIDYTLEVGALEPLLSHASSRVALKLSSQPFTASYDGSIFPANGEAEGSLTANAASIARTAAWLGASVPDGADFGTLELTGQLRKSSKVYTLSNATLTANGTTATGYVSLEATPARPMLRGELSVANLDFNTLLSPARSPQVGDDAAPTPSAAPNSASPEPVERDTQDRPAQGTRVNGYTARGGWSEDQIRLTALGATDADVKLTIGGVLYKDIKAGASRIAIALTDSVLKATIEEAALYGGRGHGFIVLDGRSPDIAHVGINLGLDNITMRPLLQDVAKLDWIEGNGNATIAVAGSGAHQRAVIESLAGKADLKVTNGAVRGIDIDRMTEKLADGQFKNLKGEPGDKTSFSGLTATWQIKDGVAANNDLKLSSQYVQVTGAGNIVLPDRSLDYTVRPKLAGQEATGAGVEVPVRVSGSWEKPQYKADVGGAVEDLGRRLKGKNTDEMVDELVGKDSKTGAKAKKLLDKLFR